MENLPRKLGPFPLLMGFTAIETFGGVFCLFVLFWFVFLLHLFSSRIPHSLSLSCLLGLVCDSFSDFLCFWPFGRFWGVQARHFAEYPLVVRCFSLSETGAMGLGEEDHRGKVPFSSRAVKGTCYQHDSSPLSTVTTTINLPCSPLSGTGKGSRYAQPTLKE